MSNPSADTGLVWKGSSDAVPRLRVISFWLFISAAVFGILACVYLIATVSDSRPTIESMLTQHHLPVTPGSVRLEAQTQTVMAIASVVIYGVPFAVFPFRARHDIMWAQIGLSIVSVLSILEIFTSVLWAPQAACGTAGAIVMWVAHVKTQRQGTRGDG